MKTKRTRKKSIVASSTIIPTSHRSTQHTISSHHILLKRRAALVKQLAHNPSESVQKQIDELDGQVEANGGLAGYQEASKLGQSVDRGGDTSKVLVEWLIELGRKGSEKLRLLEVGALASDNYASCSSWIDNTPIDLHSQHPDILEQDFFERPIPGEGDELDVVSCSLVLNYVPDPKDRGRMLQLIHSHLKPKPNSFLFLVLPLPCLTNSRYLDINRMKDLMRIIGFDLVRERWKEGGRVGYWLWAWREGDRTKGGHERKILIEDGPKKNNFCILYQPTP